MRGVAGRWVNRVGRPHRCTASSSAGFVYPSAPLSRSQTGCASLPPLPAVLRLEYGVYGPRGLEGDQTVSSHQFEEVSAGRLKSPPIYCKILIAHVKGRSTARISSMTSSQTDSQSGCEGRDGEPGSAFCLECDWTMNSWVFGRIRISLVSKVSLSPACWGKSAAEGHEGPRLQLEPLLTCSAGAAVLSRVVLEFRVKLHEMNRVAEF